LGRRYGETLGTAGVSPGGLYEALEERAIPTAEEALEYVTVLNSSGLSHAKQTECERAETGLRRFIKAHEAQPDG